MIRVPEWDRVAFPIVSAGGRVGQVLNISFLSVILVIEQSMTRSWLCGEDRSRANTGVPDVALFCDNLSAADGDSLTIVSGWRRRVLLSRHYQIQETIGDLDIGGLKFVVVRNLIGGLRVPVLHEVVAC